MGRIQKRAIAAVVGLWLAVSASASAKERVLPGVCSAFSVNGDWATATITPGLASLDIHYHSTGQSLRLTAPAPLAAMRAFGTYAVECSAFFSGDGRYFAIEHDESDLGGANGSYMPDALHIVTVDLAAQGLAGDFTVRAEGALRPPLALAGFLEHQAALVVVGFRSPTTYSEEVFSVAGKRMQGPEARAFPRPRGSELNHLLPDAKHDRMWLYTDSPQSLHNAILSASLVGPGPPAPAVQGPADLDVFLLYAFPDRSTVIAATDGNQPIVITLMSVGGGETARLDLPHATGNLTGVYKILSSPDGRAVAVVRRLSATSFFGGGVEKGYRLDFVRLSPFKLIGSVHLGARTDQASISIDDRDGVLTVLSYDGHRWRLDRAKAGSHLTL